MVQDLAWKRRPWTLAPEEVLVGPARVDDVERDLCVERVERRRRSCNDLDRLAQLGDVRPGRSPQSSRRGANAAPRE